MTIRKARNKEEKREMEHTKRRKWTAALLVFVLAFSCILSGCITIKKQFVYKHDPRENPSAMEDVIVNPDAVYGFSPNPDSKRLGTYAEYDWTDPEKVESYRQERIKYHDSFSSMYEMLDKMNKEHKSVEEMARAVSAERNRLRLAVYADDSEGLQKVKESNLEAYGNEEGPQADDLYAKYGSWEAVLQKAFGTNAGMDACCGLYDDFYNLYVELGYMPAD